MGFEGPGDVRVDPERPEGVVEVEDEHFGKGKAVGEGLGCGEGGRGEGYGRGVVGACCGRCWSLFAAHCVG